MLGLGAVGRAVAARLQGFGAELIGVGTRSGDEARGLSERLGLTAYVPVSRLDASVRGRAGADRLLRAQRRDPRPGRARGARRARGGRAGLRRSTSRAGRCSTTTRCMRRCASAGSPGPGWTSTGTSRSIPRSDPRLQRRRDAAYRGRDDVGLPRDGRRGHRQRRAAAPWRSGRHGGLIVGRWRMIRSTRAVRLFADPLASAMGMPAAQDWSFLPMGGRKQTNPAGAGNQTAGIAHRYCIANDR